jgi:hypothetical protein
MRCPNLPKALNECVAQNVLTGFPTCMDYTSKAEVLEFGVDERHYCDGKNCFTREKRADYEYRLELVEGLQLPEDIDCVPIPSLDPVIVSHDFDIPLTISPSVYGSAVAIPYWHVSGLLSSDPSLSMNFRARHHLSKDQLIVLHGEGHDNLLERLFIRSCNPHFWDICASLSPVLLIAPGYSIYSDGSQCRRWQPYNLKLSTKFFSDANNHGLPCIPWVASNHNRDTERICEWLNKQCHTLTHLAVNFQTHGPAVLKENIRFAKAIEAASIRQLHWVVFGVASEASMSQIAENLKWPVTYVTGKPMQRGRAGRSIFSQDKAVSGNRQDIVDSNVLEQRRLTETIMSSHQRRN